MTHLEFYVRSLGRLEKAAFLERVHTAVLVGGSRRAQADSPLARVKFVTLDGSIHTEAAGAGAKGGQRPVLLVKKRDGALFAGCIAVGRTPNLDVCLADEGVSKFHAYFSVTEAGVYQLTDKESKNGTFVRGARLGSGATVQLQSRDEIKFATHVYEFLLPEDFYTLVQSTAL